MLSLEEHAKLLRSFEVDRLLKLVTVEAKRLHEGHYTIFSFTTGFKVAFGTPDLDGGMGRLQLVAVPDFPTLKEALIAALVEGKDFANYCDAAGRMVPVVTYGSEGLCPERPQDCPYFLKYGTETSCLSASGSSACGGFMGSIPGYVHCGGA